MRVREFTTTPLVARPPRAMAWVLLLASALAVLLIGLAGTALILTNLEGGPIRAWWTLWPQLLAASALTVASLSLRAVRWIFLLRRSDTRIPIRDAYIGYLAGLSLLFAPLLLGEIAVRAAINRVRGRVPVTTTVVVNVWERALDAAALGLIGAVAGARLGQVTPWNWVLLAGAVLSLFGSVRRLALGVVVAAIHPFTRRFDGDRPRHVGRLSQSSAWWPALAASVAAWTLPGIGLWLLAGVWGQPFGLTAAEHAYATSSASSMLTVAPGGVLVAGRHMLSSLGAHGVSEELAVLTVVGVRLATVGVSMLIGGVFTLIHLRSAPSDGSSHFDEIADAYDVQIPEARRLALLTRKTGLMRDALECYGVGRLGLDVGCGQGAYVGQMRALGFDVSGIDASDNQVAIARKKLGPNAAVGTGSALEIPAPADTFDFVYTINVLHHLSSIAEQQRAFVELLRVLKPGGVLFVHEINTRNMLFRFYMGYVFPSLNCIDEGVERWLLPHHLGQYTDARVEDVRYFTFLPDFVPGRVARVLAPIERALEASPLKVYSAHYMAIVRKGTGHR